MGDCSVLLNVNKACFIKEERYFIIVMMCLCTPPILWRVIIVANLYVQIYALCKHFLPNKEHNNQQQNNFYATYWVLHLLDLLMLIRGGTLLPHPTSSMRARPKWLYHFQSFLSRSLALSSSSSNYVYSFTVSMLCIYGHQHVRVFSDVDCDIASTLSFEWIIEALSCQWSLLPGSVILLLSLWVVQWSDQEPLSPKFAMGYVQLTTGPPYHLQLEISSS